MKIKVLVIKKKEMPFFIVYGCYLFIAFIYTSMYSKYIVSVYRYALIALGVLLLVCEIYKNRLSLPSLIGAFVMGTVALFVSGHVDGTIYIVCLLVFVWCGRNISFDKIARFTILFSSVVISLIVLSSLLGIVENHSQVIDGRNRFYLGFRYALYLPAYLFNISTLYIYIKRKNIRWRHLIGLFVLNYIVYIQSKSRLSFILTAALILLTSLIRGFNSFFKRQKFLFRILRFSFIICFAICVILAVYYDRSISWMFQLNELLVHRISLAQRGIMQYGVSFWGKSIEWIGMGMNSYGEIITAGYNYVDCLYIKMLVQYGIIFTVLYLAINTLAMFRYYTWKKYFLIMILSFISWRVIIDDLALMLHYNTWWFAVGIIFRDTYKKNLEIEADI